MFNFVMTVVPDEKVVTFIAASRESLLLGSVMKMVQMSCLNIPRPATLCMLRLFLNEDWGLATCLTG